jgi:hypothetical protein
MLVKMNNQLVIPVNTILETFSSEELMELDGMISTRLSEDVTIPISIFSTKISPAEALTKYLKENMNLKINKIAELLHLSHKTVWANYNNSTKRNLASFPKRKNDLMIPLSCFVDTRLSVLESIILYLRDEKGIHNRDASIILKKNQAVLSTSYHRAISKLESNK